MRCDLRAWLGAGAVAAAAACPSPAMSQAALLSDHEHEGVVLDAPSGAPLPGVKVVGKWKVSYSSMAHSGERCVKVLVVETDAAGRFRFPAWSRNDTPVTSFYLTVSGYKPGYRPADNPAPLVGHPPAGKRSTGGGSVSLPPGALRLAMERWEPPAAERAKYLLQFLPSVACSESDAEWGSLYYVRKAVQDEFARFPPEVQRTKRMDYSDWLAGQVEESRTKLARETSGTKEKTP
jgi:hypothetical protein